MSELILDVRLDGFDGPVGVLVRDAYGDLAFQYEDSYRAMPNALHLSLSLPIRESPYPDSSCRAFFGNLLQESPDVLETVMLREGIERDNIAALLYHLGADCPGAISILPQGAPPAKVPGDMATDYEPMNDEQITRIVSSLYNRTPLPAGFADPSPLAGVQRKFALTVLQDGTFAKPIGHSGAPTTHILKISSRSQPNEAKLEAAALELSSGLQIDTTTAELREISGIKCLLVARYDRTIDQDGRIARLHQEDFAQALGLPSGMKYERRGRPDFKFDAVAIASIIDQTSEPALSRKTIIESTVFDLLIGNNDPHAKNFSLLFDRRGAVRIAPRYDLVPCRMFDGFTEELAYNIGPATRFEDVTVSAFDAYLEILGVPSSAAKRRLRNQTTAKISEYLAQQFATMDAAGERIFADHIASNIRHLNDAFGIEIPEAAQKRDAWIADSGAWAWS